jgi:formylglycine-generating enzyme required for sulfatase activity
VGIGVLASATACGPTRAAIGGRAADQGRSREATSCPTGMVRIERGAFAMGSAAGRPEDGPVHTARVTTFCLDITAVTVRAYQSCVWAGVCAAALTVYLGPDVGVLPEQQGNFDFMCNAGHADRLDHPANCVSWDDATAYCARAGGRLPTEEEWEYAARGGEGRKYPWGNAPAPGPRLLNLCGNGCAPMANGLEPPDRWQTDREQDGWVTTAPVGSYPAGATPSGLLDMAGNIGGWTSSEYSRGYFQPPLSGRMVLRGAGWDFNKDDTMLSTVRLSAQHSARDPGVGFRCAR